MWERSTAVGCIERERPELGLGSRSTKYQSARDTVDFDGAIVGQARAGR